MRATCVLALGLHAVAGCDLGKEALSEEKFCQQYAHYECGGFAAACGTPADACERVRATACRERAMASKTGGRMYNPANTQSCLKAVQDAYKSPSVPVMTLENVARTCERVFQGMSQPNQPCQIDYDCIDSLICDKGLCGTPKMVSSGNGCANIGEFCPPAEFCSNMNSAKVYVCTKAQAKGQACGPGQPCDPTYRCMGTCVDKLGVGAPCNADDECSTRYCNPYVRTGEVRVCLGGLGFAFGSASCDAYMGTTTARLAPDAGASGDAGM